MTPQTEYGNCDYSFRSWIKLIRAGRVEESLQTWPDLSSQPQSTWQAFTGYVKSRVGNNRIWSISMPLSILLTNPIPCQFSSFWTSNLFLLTECIVDVSEWLRWDRGRSFKKKMWKNACWSEWMNESAARESACDLSFSVFNIGMARLANANNAVHCRPPSTVWPTATILTVQVTSVEGEHGTWSINSFKFLIPLCVIDL